MFSKKQINGLINKDDIKEILATRKKIQKECKRIAKEIESDPNYDYKNSLFVSILEGAIQFSTELQYLMKDNIFTDTIRATSYSGTKKNKTVITKELKNDITGKTIFLIDEIVDSGDTMSQTKKHLLKNGAKEVKIIAMIYKPHNVKTPDLKIDHYAFNFDGNTDWLVGFGLDCNEACRTLPFIASLTASGINKLMKQKTPYKKQIK